VADLTRASIHEAMREAVPEFGPTIDEHLEEFGEDVRYLLFGDMTRFVLAARADGATDLVERCLAFLDLALREGDDSVQDLVAVGFVENVGLWDPANRSFIRSWPAALKAEAQRQADWKPGQA
jgi:hypothetical protein